MVGGWPKVHSRGAASARSNFCGYNAHVRTISDSEAKNQLGALLDRVKAGEVILIVEKGVPVARLSPVSGVAREGLALLDREGLIRRGLRQLVDLEALPWPKEAGALEVLRREREEGR